jgi:hypothetical protein
MMTTVDPLVLLGGAVVLLVLLVVLWKILKVTIKIVFGLAVLGFLLSALVRSGLLH